MHNSSAKFNPKTWAYFNKYWAIGKNIVANFLRQSENLGNKNKTQKKPSQLNTIENMEAVKAGITEKSLLITHIFHRQRESALNFAYDTLIRAELSYHYQEEAKTGRCLSNYSTK